MTSASTMQYMHMAALGKTCPSCQGPMELEVGSCPSGSASLLNWFHVDVYTCPRCGRKSLGGPLFNN